jgi:hypothetical protein
VGMSPITVVMASQNILYLRGFVNALKGRGESEARRPTAKNKSLSHALSRCSFEDAEGTKRRARACFAARSLRSLKAQRTQRGQVFLCWNGKRAAIPADPQPLRVSVFLPRALSADEHRLHSYTDGRRCLADKGMMEDTNLSLWIPWR